MFLFFFWEDGWVYCLVWCFVGELVDLEECYLVMLVEVLELNYVFYVVVRILDGLLIFDMCFLEEVYWIFFVEGGFGSVLVEKYGFVLMMCEDDCFCCYVDELVL